MATCTNRLVLSITQSLQYSVRFYSNLLRPRQTKYRKFQKRLRNIKPFKPEHVEPPTLHQHYVHGIYALEGFRMTAAQIEAARMALVRTLGRKKSSIVRYVFPHIPVTKKPVGARMGKGKGEVDHYVAFVKPGSMLFAFTYNEEAKKACKAVSYKLPIKVALVEKSSNLK